MEMNAANPATTIREVGLPIYQSKGWLKFLGVLSILQGIMAAITLVGLIIAWLPIWIGVVLYQSANSIEAAHVSGNKAHLVQALGKLKLYFTIQGIMTLIMLAFMVFSVFISGLGMLGALLES